jgi:hypothetical protein
MKTKIGLIVSVICSAYLLADQSITAHEVAQMDQNKAVPQAPAVEKPLPKVMNGRSFNTVVFAEFLYWKFTSPALVFGRDGVGLTNSSPQLEIPVTKTGGSFSPNFKYDPGYRVGFGFLFGPEKAFDIAVRYTWFYTNPKRHVNSDDFSASFLPISFLTSNVSASAVYHSARFSMNLHYYGPEVQSGYTFKVNRYLALRPYMALTSIIIDADVKAAYDFTTSGSFETARTHGDCFSWSIGPKIGLDFTARPVTNFAVYCGVNFTQQCSQLNMKTRQTDSSGGSTFVLQKGKQHEIRSVPLFGFEIGPMWDAWCCNDRYHFQLRAVWQASTLGAGNLSFLNNNNVGIPVAAELRGFNVRALLEF